MLVALRQGHPRAVHNLETYNLAVQEEERETGQGSSALLLCYVVLPATNDLHAGSSLGMETEQENARRYRVLSKYRAMCPA
jgi:hypothetical protein